jgi:hypothetical protein
MFIKVTLKERNDDFLKRIIILKDYIFIDKLEYRDLGDFCSSFHYMMELCYLNKETLSSMLDITFIISNYKNEMYNHLLTVTSFPLSNNSIEIRMCIERIHKDKDKKLLNSFVVACLSDEEYKNTKNEFNNKNYIVELLKKILEINENTLALAKRCNVINENYTL